MTSYTSMVDPFDIISLTLRNQEGGVWEGLEQTEHGLI